MCERGIKLRKSTAEHSTQLRTCDGRARLCVVALHCFFHLYWKKCTHELRQATTQQCFLFPCAASTGISSPFIWAQPLLAQETTNALRLRGCISGYEAQSPLLPPLPGQTLSAVQYSRLPWAPSPGLPKCVLSFWQEGLGGPRNRPSACSSSSTLCVPGADLPCPPASALSSRPCGIIPAVPSPGEGPSAAALVSRVTVRGKKKIPLRWLAFVEGSNQYPGHPAEVPEEKHVNPPSTNLPPRRHLPPTAQSARRALLCP